MMVNDNEYILSLIKESLGHNKRKNRISLFGLDKQNEYILKTVNEKDSTKKNIWLFIDNNSKGIYTLDERMMIRKDGKKENYNN